MKSVSPGLVVEGREERVEGVVEEAAEAHPQVVEVPADNPGASKEA